MYVLFKDGSVNGENCLPNLGPCALVWKNPSRTCGCCEKEEFYCRKGERYYVLYWERGGSMPVKGEKKKKDSGLFQVVFISP
jgi:hypothetical protein